MNRTVPVGVLVAFCAVALAGCSRWALIGLAAASGAATGFANAMSGERRPAPTFTAPPRRAAPAPGVVQEQVHVLAWHSGMPAVGVIDSARRPGDGARVADVQLASVCQWSRLGDVGGIGGRTGGQLGGNLPSRGGGARVAVIVYAPSVVEAPTRYHRFPKSSSTSAGGARQATRHWTARERDALFSDL